MSMIEEQSGIAHNRMEPTGYKPRPKSRRDRIDGNMKRREQLQLEFEN